MTLTAAAILCLTPLVSDADTLRCANVPERIRLQDIDAPETRGSPACRGKRRATHWCGQWQLAEQSRDALRAFLMRGPVAIERRGLDRYGRTLAVVRVNGADAGEYLVRRGLAMEWK